MADPAPPPDRPAWIDLLIAWRWPLVVLLLASGAMLVGLFAVDRVARSVAGVAGEARHAAIDIAERFRSGRITTTFLSSVPIVSGAGSGRLEVATLDVDELLSRTDERWLMWDLVPLGTTVSEIRVPVTYRYFVHLDDPWRLETIGQLCRVEAPRLRPALPPAIHTDGMHKRTESGWLRFDSGARLDELERSLTPTLTTWALSPRRTGLVRDEARKTVARFVRNWLLAEDHWRDDRFRAIVVTFADEEETESRPTIRLSEEPAPSGP